MNRDEIRRNAIRKRKIAARYEARAEREVRREERRYRRACFWTRPFGHKYVAERPVETDGMIPTLVCIGCGKPKR